MKNVIYYIAPAFLRIVLFFIFITCRWKIYNKSFLEEAKREPRPVLICCWHNSFILVARYFKKISLRVSAVSSTHRDSQIMAKILYGWNFKLIRGSSTRGWAHVLRSMIALFTNNNSLIAVTNDGPKGPPFVAKKGTINLALKYNVQIVAASGTASNYWTLPSWDKTIIPKPFSTIYIQFASPFDNTMQAITNEAAEISDYINQNHDNLNQKVHG